LTACDAQQGADKRKVQEYQQAHISSKQTNNREHEFGYYNQKAEVLYPAHLKRHLKAADK